ncbi:MAG: Lrp/AsnC family transcriptional regulator [Erysipelotrichales bacterium]
MDSIDVQILKLLHDNSRASITQISETIELSRSSVNERINKLVEQDIIEKFSLRISNKNIGYPIIFYATIRNIKIDEQVLIDKIKALTNVINIDAVTGNINYIVKAATASIEDLDYFLNQIKDICKVEATIVLHNVEQDLFREPLNSKK